MATSQQDLVEEIISGMYAYTQQQPAATTLTQTILPSDVNIPFDSTINVSRGIIEIDDELIYVMVSNNTNNTLSSVGWGRGYAGSTAAGHAAGARILVDPMFPRKRVNDAINEVIGALDGDLYGITTYEFTPTSSVTTYTLPVGTAGVLTVSQQSYGPSLAWRKVGRFEVDLAADASLGRSITFFENLSPGRTVKVILQQSLLPINNGDLLTASNLTESHRDLVVMGVQVKLLMSMDFGRLQTSMVQSAAREQSVPITSASTIAGRLNQQFQKRVQDEKYLLMQQVPTRITRSN